MMPSFIRTTCVTLHDDGEHPPEAWSRTTVHSQSGLVTLRQLVWQAVRHLRHHLPFLAEKRAALGIGGPSA